MNYLYENHRYEGWKPVITVLIGSGMRIGECLGLRWQDLDFENRTISVNHNLVHRKLEKGGESLHINTPKTAAGMRTIPMIEQVYEAFMEEYQIQQITGFCTQEIEGYMLKNQLHDVPLMLGWTGDEIILGPEENSEEALYRGIRRLLDDPALLEHYREMAKKRGRDFSTEETVKSVESMLLSLI